MEKFKENIQMRQKQNIVSTVLMICFLVLVLAFWGALYSDRAYTADASQEIAQNIEI